MRDVRNTIYVVLYVMYVMLNRSASAGCWVLGAGCWVLGAGSLATVP